MQEEEIIYDDLQPSEAASDITVKEVTYAVEVTDVEAFQIEMDEAFPASGEVDISNHALLTNRELHDAHPITAITGLREELDSIEALQTLYSDKKGNADYYEWADGLALGENGVGYFVSLNQDVRTISICTGDDIFGVVVPSAAFVGGQDNVARDDHYGLVATTGAVHVRCELDVTVGDYVVSNTYGVATSTNSGHGFKVVALHDIDHAPYATINLNISADQVDLMGSKLQNLDSRMDAAESNIISAINVAHEAYNKAGEMIIISGDASQKAQDALDTSNKVLDSVESLEDAALKSQQIAAQAKAIADGALVSAESIRKEAVDEANNALAEAAKLRDEFALMEEGINEVEDQIAIVAKKVNGKYTVVASWSEANKESDVVYYAEDTKLYWYYDSNLWKSTDDPSVAGLPMALSGLQVEVDEHSASIDGLVDWRDGTNYAMARIEQKADANGAYIQSTVSNMNKYAVGPHSQSYGFTLEQAASVLEEGMMYVPTTSHTEEYTYTDTDETVKKQSRSFTPQYLYKWGVIGDRYGWITVDKNYNETNETNDSAKAVYFTTTMPIVSGDFGYWYTNGDNVDEGYEPYTLYKWDLPYKYQTQQDDGTIVAVEEYHWIAVATLAGNSQSRAVSQIRQSANSIEAEVVDAYGAVAGFGAKLSETDAKVNSITSWPTDGEKHNMVILEQKADDDGAYMVLAAVTDVDGKSTVSELGGAKIVLSDSDLGSYIKMDADYINFETVNFTIDAGRIDFTTEDFTIEANHIDFDVDDFTISANKIDFTTDDFTIEAKHINFDADDFKIDASNLDLSAYYTKTEVNNTLNSYVTTTTMNSALSLKADSATLGSYYTKTEVNNTLNSYVTTTNMNSALSLKADSATLGSYYTKTEVNTQLQGYYTTTQVDNKISISQQGILQSVSGTYATKDALGSYYTKNEVNGKLALTIEAASDGTHYSQLSGYTDKIIFNAGDIEIRAGNTGLLSNSPVRFYSGAMSNKIGEVVTTVKTVSKTFPGIPVIDSLTIDGCQYICSVTATTYFTSGGSGSAYILNTFPNYGNTVHYRYGGSGHNGSISFTITYVKEMDSKFLVLEDGSLFASQGSIGGWEINDSSLSATCRYTQNNTRHYQKVQLTPDGLTVWRNTTGDFTDTIPLSFTWYDVLYIIKNQGTSNNWVVDSW